MSEPMRDTPTTNARPWTPGPWTAYQHYGERFVGGKRQDAAEVHGDGDDEIAANAELIALAPEMAAALLAWDEARPCGGEQIECVECCECLVPSDNALQTLADKLRAIGGSDE